MSDDMEASEQVPVVFVDGHIEYLPESMIVCRLLGGSSAGLRNDYTFTLALARAERNVEPVRLSDGRFGKVESWRDEARRLRALLSAPLPGELAEIEARVDALPPGEWSGEDNLLAYGPHEGAPGEPGCFPDHRRDREICVYGATVEAVPVATFLRHARTDVPRLLAGSRVQAAELAVLRGLLSQVWGIMWRREVAVPAGLMNRVEAVLRAAGFQVPGEEVDQGAPAAGGSS